jgi:hypothetical protein
MVYQVILPLSFIHAAKEYLTGPNPWSIQFFSLPDKGKNRILELLWGRPLKKRGKHRKHKIVERVKKVPRGLFLPNCIDCQLFLDFSHSDMVLTG